MPILPKGVAVYFFQRNHQAGFTAGLSTDVHHRSLLYPRIDMEPTGGANRESTLPPYGIEYLVGVNWGAYWS